MSEAKELLERLKAERRIRHDGRALGAEDDDIEALLNGDVSAVSDKVAGIPITNENRDRVTRLVSDVKTVTAPTPAQQELRRLREQKALELGVKPGVALTPEQSLMVASGQPINAEDPTMAPGPYQRKPPADSGPFMTGTGQGLLNLGSGYLRAYYALADQLGDEEAKQYLRDLEISQTMEQGQTGQVSRDAPIRGFAGEVTGETIGMPFGGAGNSVLTRLFTAALGGGTNAGFASAGRGDEPATVAGQTALGGTFGTAGEVGGQALRRWQTGRQAANIAGVEATDDVITAAAEQVDAAQMPMAETDIRLLPAQQTLDPFQLEQQAFLGSNPEVSRKAFNVLKDQNREAAEAVGNLLNLIAGPEVTGTAAARTRAAAETVIDAAKVRRSNRAGPIYREAFEEGALVDLTTVNTLIDDTLADLPAKGGKIRSSIMKVKKLLEGSEKVGPDGKKVTQDPTLRQLHGAKIEIDEMIAAKGEKGLGPTTKYHLLQIQKQLVESMREASPKYGEAMETFAANSPPVDALRDGLIGRLAKLKDTDLKRASTILFDAAETNPEVLRSAIRVLKTVEGGDEVIRGLMRTELQRRLGRLKVGVENAASTGGRRLENTPQHMMNAIFGNDAQRNILLTALDDIAPEAGRNARWLEQALDRAAQGRPGGSQTGIRAEITRRLRGASLAVRDFLRAPISGTLGIGEDVAFGQRVRALGDALYDPDWAPDMRRIRALGAGSEAARSQLEELLNAILEQNSRIGVSRQAVGVAGRQEVTDLIEDQNNE